MVTSGSLGFVTRLRVGVLVSGTGSLLQAILEGQDDLYEVGVVVSDRPGVKALERAARAGVETVVVDWAAYGPQRRPEFSSEVARAQRERGIELSCSAGFMRILSPNYFGEVAVPYMNSHPALLPSFPGAHGVRDALTHGVKVTGTTIIFADEGVDSGPIIAQRSIDVLPDDDEESLHARIKLAEQELYPEVVRLFAQGRLKLEGRRVHIVPL
jgi:phosphoribosylglycinamide formyltransferase-1